MSSIPLIRLLLRQIYARDALSGSRAHLHAKELDLNREMITDGKSLCEEETSKGNGNWKSSPVYVFVAAAWMWDFNVAFGRLQFY